jgi:hypothetical protein
MSLFLSLIIIIIIVKGAAKIARKLGFDYAEAVVRSYLNLVRLDVTADSEHALPKFNNVQPYLLHRLDLNSRNAERFP